MIVQCALTIRDPLLQGFRTKGGKHHTILERVTLTMTLLGGDERRGKIMVCVFFVCACRKCGRYSSKWFTSGQLPFLHRQALQQQPGASLACRSSLCLLFVLPHSLTHWLSDRSAQEVLCDVTCDKKTTHEGW